LSFPIDENLKREYLKALKKEIMLNENKEYIVDTVFLGGGTPSLLEPKEIDDIIMNLNSYFNISKDAEITMEANPGTLKFENLLGFKEAGINRLSLGVQSLDEDVLSHMGRIHNAEDVYWEYELARKAGFNNINLDLMFSVPNYNIFKIKRTLTRAIKLKPEHISYYGLQLEEGTPYFEQFKKGMFHETDDYMDRRMYHEGSRLLINKGYNRYEISNFSKHGYECKHNLKYWNMDEYLGLGLGSSSFIGGYRLKNAEDINSYINFDKKPIIEKHHNSKNDNVSEAIFTGLRKTEGIEISSVLGSESAFWEYFNNIKDVIWEYEMDGCLIIDQGRIRFTEYGIDISNKILANFV